MTSWTDLDFAFRGAATAMMLVAATIFIRSSAHQAARLGALLMICTAAQMVLGAAPAAAPLELRLLLGFTGTLAIPLFWLFARAWFDDEFALSTPDALLALGFTALGTLQYARPDAAPLAWVDVLAYAGGTGFALHSQWLVWRGRNDDLVEHRRRIRALFIVVVGVFILWSMWSEALSRVVAPGVRPEALLAVNSAVLCGVTFALTTALFGLRHADIFPVPGPGAIAPAAKAAGNAEDEPIDEALAARLAELMRSELLYRDPGLTIGQLAGRLNIPEYRVRRLINGGLGYRNFNEYLNSHRIEEVRAALTDQGQAGVSILTIALDAGFGSLPAFNRAFKSSCGETPSEYRRKALAAA